MEVCTLQFTLWYWIESLLSWHPSTSANSVTINIPTRAHVMCNFFWAHQVGLQVFLVRPIKRTFPEPWNSKPHLTVKSVTKLSQLSTMAELNQGNTNGAGEPEEDDDYMGDLSRFIPPETSLPPKPASKKVSLCLVWFPRKLCNNNNCQNCLGFYRFYNLLHSLVLNSTFFFSFVTFSARNCPGVSLIIRQRNPTTWILLGKFKTLK